MFEKEAEEYVLENFSSDYYGEFEMEQITEYSAFQKGAKFGYNKANEWHYVKDGDLPKENKKYWVFTSNGEPKVDSWVSISWATFYGVIAWKEIVLPELKEIE